MMTKQTAAQVQQEIRDAMGAILERHNLAWVKSRVVYGDDGLKVSFDLAVKGEHGESIQPRNDWNRYATLYGFAVEEFGAEFTANGTRYRIAGLMPSRRKYPVIAAPIYGRKNVLFTADGVRRALDREKVTA